MGRDGRARGVLSACKKEVKNLRVFTKKLVINESFRLIYDQKGEQWVEIKVLMENNFTG